MNLNSLFVKSIRTRSHVINYQTVRWRRPRKPFWLGVAKSKMFVIREPKVIRSPEETEERYKLLNNYGAELKSILHFIKEVSDTVVGKSNEADQEHTQLESLLERSIADSLICNNNFNQESARRREERMKKVEEEEVKKAIEMIQLAEENKRKHMEFVDEVVRKEKVVSTTFITPENIDEAVEQCLKKVDVYDFAIDLNGNRYYGRESLQVKEENTAEKMAESSSA